MSAKTMFTLHKTRMQRGLYIYCYIYVIVVSVKVSAERQTWLLHGCDIGIGKMGAGFVNANVTSVTFIC